MGMPSDFRMAHAVVGVPFRVGTGSRTANFLKTEVPLSHLAPATRKSSPPFKSLNFFKFPLLYYKIYDFKSTYHNQ